ncbi:D-alanine--D-alanine ligase [Acropora cervicornis]|uniref:D-alanine--D-alanine ligase n=1 Tax=Acropora cervicornis TaxID=6130 RepID=A0AAD9R7W8_ACRCE|nr:D-alanine--D-alanine ligase [Acropora cervicornis]
MDKLKTRNTLLADQSVPCDSVTLGKVFYPCVVKASKGKDTMGVRLAKDQQSFLAALEHALSFSDQVIVERFIEGREIRCAVVESVSTGQLKALSCLEYNIRHDDIRKTEDNCQAFKALGLKDFGLFDFRVDHNGSPFFLECNLFCSFGPQSVLNAIAKDSGFTDKELFDLMVDNALLRRKKPLNGFHYSKKLIDA